MKRSPLLKPNNPLMGWGSNVKIIELQAENVKRIRAVTIRPDGNVVTINGENGQGKSSCLDAIAYALGGKDLHPPEVIRRGEESAQVVVDLGEIIVKRRWTAGGTSLTVESKEGGVVFKSPQTMLDKLVGELSFNPIKFLGLEPKVQAKTLRELVGVDTSAIEAAHSALYTQRTQVTITGKELSARFDAMPAPAADVPDEPVSVDALLDEQMKLQARKTANDTFRNALADAVMTLDRQRERLRTADDRVRRLQDELHAATAIAKEAGAAVDVAMAAEKEQREQASKLVDPDISEVVRKISRADATNQAVREKKARQVLEAHLKEKREEAKALNKKLADLDTEKAKLISTAKFPVPGLGFTADGLTLNGLPLEQASGAERLRVSLAMGLALNPKLKVVLIHDASLLDKKSLAMVAEMAAAADAQVWLEVVGTGPIGIEIVDGAVVAPVAASNASNAA